MIYASLPFSYFHLKIIKTFNFILPVHFFGLQKSTYSPINQIFNTNKTIGPPLICWGGSVFCL